MADIREKPEMIIYDEKPACGRCGSTITGVVSSTWDGKPLCRECAFDLGEKARRPRKRLVIREETFPSAQGEKARRRAALGFIGLVAVVFLWRIFAVAPLLKPAQPLRNGTYRTDRLADECISQLWELSKLLQEDRLPDTLPLCPQSGRPYVLTREGDDTVISCPNPAEHGLEALWVSRFLPPPTAIQGEWE